MAQAEEAKLRSLCMMRMVWHQSEGNSTYDST